MHVSEGLSLVDIDFSRSVIMKILFNEMPTPSMPPAPVGSPNLPSLEDVIIDCPRRPKLKIPSRLPWSPVVPKRPPTVH